ncbi:ribbon-helix-helix domain-containing protein [Mycoplana dimorpha]|uniref:Putative DNA-binding ribbon-helix-helix protein n=1 Tax=Mycoplana dimorpha TaxID=28320 RepID=A0A2T5AXN3_MYCDI|nr:ribbon-helix-helix domain-containing protein [Mycoplana dimorpha]PTM91467.1 putative DNA-binding ribbon-helix-helix protein [Mycoplana dimorpha]
MAAEAAKGTELSLEAVEWPLQVVAEAEVEPHFRAIAGPNGERRGVRLERLYWEGLSRIAAAGRTSVTDLVNQAAAAQSGSSNLASLLRVLSLKWALRRVDAMEEVASTANLNALVQASPSPALVLTLDKRIQFFNDPFLSLLRNRLLLNDPAQLARALRFSIDTPIEDAMATLSRGKGKMLCTGFGLSLGQHSIKGQINLALAPAHEKPMLIGYIARL